MKKIFSTIVVLMLALTLCVNMGATETTVAESGFVQEETLFEEIESEIVIEDITEEVDEKVPEILPEDEYHTLFTRLWEYCVTYKTELVGVLGDIAIFVLALFIKLRNDKRAATMARDIVNIKGDTSGTSKSQASVVGVVNEMVDGYNALKMSYDKYGETEDDRNRVVGALVAQNTAILEILTTVYANSKNLPQGVKDLVTLKYANCLKSLDDDEQLKAIITAVRDNIGTNMTVEAAEEKENQVEV